MRGLGPDVIDAHDHLRREFLLNPETRSLLHVRSAGILLYGTDMTQLIVNGRRIQPRGGKSVLQQEGRRLRTYWHGGCGLHQERWIKRELIFTSKALQQQIVHSVTAADNRFLLRRVSNAKPGREFVSFNLHKERLPSELDEANTKDPPSGGLKLASLLSPEYWGVAKS